MEESFLDFGIDAGLIHNDAPVFGLHTVLMSRPYNSVLFRRGSFILLFFVLIGNYYIIGIIPIKFLIVYLIYIKDK